MYADGTVWDQRRWNGATPQSAWIYATTVIGSNITSADHLARRGDLEPYTYSSSEGVHGSDGGPKSLLLAIRLIADMTLGNVSHYASTDATLTAPELINPDGESPNPVQQFIYDVAFAQANIYYQDSLILSCYGRIMDATPNDGGYVPWGGDWGNLPGALFMFGLQEGVVNPYL